MALLHEKSLQNGTFLRTSLLILMTLISAPTSMKKRIQNHRYSAESKSKRGKEAEEPPVNIGDIVHIKTDGTKHTAREFYMVTDLHRDTKEASLQKFCGSQIRGKKYRVKLTNIYCVVSSPNEDLPLTKQIDSDDSDLEITEPIVMGEETLRRSTRIRRQPEWLSTPEIQRGEEEDDAIV